jgi:hypothetical protein
LVWGLSPRRRRNPGANTATLAGGAIDLHEVALPKTLDPRGVYGEHSRVLCPWYVPGERASWAKSTTCASLFRHPGLAQASPVGSFEQGAYLRYLEISGLQAGEAPIEVVI